MACQRHSAVPEGLMLPPCELVYKGAPVARCFVLDWFKKTDTIIYPVYKMERTIEIIYWPSGLSKDVNVIFSFDEPTAIPPSLDTDEHVPW